MPPTRDKTLSSRQIITHLTLGLSIMGLYVGYEALLLPADLVPSEMELLYGTVAYKQSGARRSTDGFGISTYSGVHFVHVGYRALDNIRVSDDVEVWIHPHYKVGSFGPYRPLKLTVNGKSLLDFEEERRRYSTLVEFYRYGFVVSGLLLAWAVRRLLRERHQ